MIIKNGYVFCEDKTFCKKDVYIENGIFCEEEAQVTDKTIVDAEGKYVIPGLIDIHSHGAVGFDFSDGNPEGLKRILEYEKSCGITSYCPTSMTLKKEELLPIFSTVNEIQQGKDTARLLGINMEGPFLDPKKKGAHVEENIINPDVEFFRECNQKSGNMIRVVTVAPNMPNAMEFIRELKDEVCISIGHTGADYETTKAALSAGANHITHLYNAMPPFAHREPGVIGAAAEDENCMPELISDGIHIHPSVVRATFQLFKDRVVLISDSMRATGLKDGTYDLGGQTVYVKGRCATLEDGTIAGSATNLFDCMRTAISFGISREEAIAAATMNPAKSVGVFHKVGSITPGKYADVLILDEELRLEQVIS